MMRRVQRTYCIASRPRYSAPRRSALMMKRPGSIASSSASRERRGLAIELARECLGRQRRPRQAARGEGKAAIHAADARQIGKMRAGERRLVGAGATDVDDRADHRQTVDRHAAEADAAFQRRRVDAGGATGQHVFDAREVDGVARCVRVRVVAVEIVSRPATAMPSTTGNT